MSLTGIVQLKSIWSKALGLSKNDSDWDKDNFVLNLLGIGLLPTFQFLHEHKPDFESFEKWVIQQHGMAIDSSLVDACNNYFVQAEDSNNPYQEAVLSADDLKFWNEKGYVIVKNAITFEDVNASKKAIWDFLQKEEEDANTWYQPHPDWQGIMVNLYRHPTLDSNRHSVRIKKAFEQIWGTNQLVVTTDKVGYNPPETDSFKYRGIGLHWDTSLASPIPFGVQGILYLTDTLPHQGALTLVPGFHLIIHEWLKQLPTETNPREVDLTTFHPIPIAANAGDLIIWNHALPHGSSPNRASLPRLVQYLYWSPPITQLQQKWL